MPNGSGYEGYHLPTGHQPDSRRGDGTIMPRGHESQLMPRRDEHGYSVGPANSSMAAVAQLFARLSQEIEEKKPANCVHFIVGFLCQHYPEHLHGFASIWQMDPDLERERHEVVNFFKSHKISTAVAAHFTNAGYDTLDTLTTLSPDNLVDVEAFNNVKWLPGHKVRLQQIFSEIAARVRAYRQAHPNQTNQIVGHTRYSRPSSPTGRPAIGGPMTSTPGNPHEYVVSVSQPVRVPQALPLATAGIDTNRDGRANITLTGVDMNRDGIPDVLQQHRGPQLALPAPMPGVYPPAAPPVALHPQAHQGHHNPHGHHHKHHGTTWGNLFGFGGHGAAA